LDATSAGYLEPDDVEAASAVVPPTGELIRKDDREIHTVPRLKFRESLPATGLLCKHEGTLLLSAPEPPRSATQRSCGHIWPSDCPSQGGRVRDRGEAASAGVRRNASRCAVVIQPRLQSAVVNQVGLATRDPFDELVEADEVERRRSCGGFDDQIDVGVRAG
jgi:hypothetical protein